MKGHKMVLRGLVLTLLLLIKGHECLDVRFEDPTSGFFLRETSSSVTPASTPLDVPVAPTTSIILGSSSNENKLQKGRSKLQKSAAASAPLGSDILHAESFTVVHSAHPAVVRAEYGPFESSQMVPTQYLVPDLTEKKNTLEAQEKTLITDFEPHQLDLSAHLVTNEVPKDQPVLRVLFHTGNHHNVVGQQHHNSQICIQLTASLLQENNEERSQICSLKESGKEGTCLGQLTLPSSWWPSFTPKDLVKQPKIRINVKYSVFETPMGCEETPRSSRIAVSPETPIGAVTLTHPAQSYHQLAKDEMLHMLMPTTPLYPSSKFFVPVFLEEPLTGSRAPITALTIKCRTRSGLRLLGVEEVSKAWTVRVELNARGTVATVTAFKKSLQTTSNFRQEQEQHQQEEYQKKKDDERPVVKAAFGPHELFNWLLVIDERDYDIWDQPRITWHVKYQRPLLDHASVSSSSQADQASSLNIATTAIDGRRSETTSTFVESNEVHHNTKDSYRLRAKVSVKKDEVQAVLPIAKHKDLMNLAVLTGRQVSRPLKIFIVSQAGDVADVTLHSSCSSSDQSVLKVTSSCTSVYVDGSESRGALSAEIDIKYGSPQYMGKAIFTVWMPETPLNIDVEDPRLSQIKGWKVPSSQPQYFQHQESSKNETMGKSRNCNLRYQQTTVRVFAKFLAQDSDSGRTEYFPSRSTELDVTELVMGHGLRISNSGVATLREGNIVQGLNPGRTEIKVVSPITGQEIGMREVRVAKNRESIRRMNVRLLSAMNLEVQADQKQGQYHLQTGFSTLLSSKYQEALLDIELEMSDDTKLPLREVDPEDYYLAIKSLDSSVIALAPSRDARFPRVIAVGNGQGQLLRTSLELIDNCMETKSSNLALAIQLAPVNVQFKNSKNEVGQTASSGNELWPTENTKDAEDMSSILSNIALRDDHSYYYNEKKQSSMLKPSYESTHHSIIDGHLTPLEIGIYILVAVLCAAIAVLMASCFVSASKYRRQMYPVSLTASLSQHILQERSNNNNKKPIQNANDWVWLGKSTSTLDKSTESVRSSCHSEIVNVIQNPQDNLQEPERIPLNQLNTNYPRQQYRVLPETYENYRPSRRMQLPKIPGKKRRLLPQVNSATYTKKVADLNNRATPPGILPVGYPVFLPEEDLSPYLPDPSSMDSLRAPLRQSPASALPPVLVEASEEEEVNEVEVEKVERHRSPAPQLQNDADYYSNPDIHRPSPPRAGAPRLFENPFELTDDDSAPVEPKKLSPSHVFESTSLEDSLLLLEAKAATPMSEKRPLDTRTFVIRRSRSSEMNKAAQTPPSEQPDGTLEQSEEIPLGAEAADEAEEHDMDYDNLMAYFENLKESNA